MSFPKYEAYKDSGVEWLGEVPTHWEVGKFKWYLRTTSGGTPPSSDINTYYGGDIPWLRSLDLNDDLVTDFEVSVTQKAINETSCRLVPRHSVLIAMYGGDGTIGKNGLLMFDSAINQALCAFLPTLSFEPKYLHRYVQFYRPYWMINAESSRKDPNIGQDRIGDHYILSPPCEEQTQIARFLDREIARIDALIAEQQRLIELLKEKRQAVISHAVTKGLDPTAPMKDSGVEWIGNIPEHWRMVMVKHTAESSDKSFTDGNWIESPYITEEGVRLIQTGNVGIGKYKEQGFRYISEETFSSLNCTEIFPNDVLVCRLDGPVGRACLVPSLNARMITSVDNAILRPSEDFDSRFIVYTMSSNLWLEWIQALCRVGGGFRFRISRSQLGDFRIPAPPVKEQKAISDMLDTQFLKLDRLAEEIDQAISTLQERRSALISAAVTGKIDVRGWQAPTSASPAPS